MHPNTFLTCCAFALCMTVPPASSAVTVTKDANTAQTNQPDRKNGTVTAISPGATLTIDGVAYEFSGTLAPIHGADGKPATPVSLTKGTAVSFTSVADGPRQRITELWIVKK